MIAKSKSDQNKRAAEPIKSSEDIERIRSNLMDSPRDLLLFDLAIQTGIGMKKLLQLKARHLMGVEVGGKIAIKPSTNNRYSVIMTDIIHDTFNKYLEKVGPKAGDYLFKSKKGQQPLNLSSVSNMITGWFKEADIRNCSGAISLRKTWEHNRKNKTNVDKDTSSSEPKALFKPIEITTTQQKIYQELFQAIISRKIPPGSILTTAEISKSFGVSHAPVRVAMNWLEAKGFIESHKKKGSIVKEFSHKELHEMIEIRLILETAAAKLSYKIRSEETLNLLESIIDSYKKGYNFEDLDRMNRAFHQTLYRDANMPMLISMITDLYDRFSPYAVLAFTYEKQNPDLIPHQEIPEYHHKKIIEALSRREFNKMVKHIRLDIKRAMLFTQKALEEKP